MLFYCVIEPTQAVYSPHFLYLIVCFMEIPNKQIVINPNYVSVPRNI